MHTISRQFLLLCAIALAWHCSSALAQLDNKTSNIYNAYSRNADGDAVDHKLPAERGVRAATGITLNAAARSALQSSAVDAQSLNLNRTAVILRAALDATTTVNLVFTNVGLLDTNKPTLGYQASGYVDGNARGTVTWVDRAGVVSAVIQLHDKQLQIRPMPFANAAATSTVSGKKSPTVASKQSMSPTAPSDYVLLDINQRQFRDHPASSFAQEAAAFLAEGKLRRNANTALATVPPPLVKTPAADAIASATPSQALNEDAITIVDVLIVYTAASVRAIGGAAAMDSYISLAIAQTNQAYTASGAKQQLRLVHSEEVAYTESADLNLDLGALRTNGDGTLDDVHLLRDAYGADIVSLWVEDGGSGCGLGFVMDTVGAYFGRSAFNVVARSCVVGNYSFAHELGHSMGLRHDTFVDDAVTPYAFGHGYVDVANKFRTIMAYDDACVAANTSCTRIGQFSSATAKYGQFATGNETESNAAAALNATRSTVAAFKAPIDLNAGGSIQFYPQNYGVIEGKTVSLTVARLGGTEGVASVRYLTAPQTATANRDFRNTSGALVWRDGEDGEKIILIDTLLDSENEGTEKFRVELIDFVGATPLVNSINGGSTATVDIFDSAVDGFPIDCVLPTKGWSTPANATAGWSVGRDSSTEGGCSLKSTPMLSVGNSTRAQLQFEGEFNAGVITFDRRVISEQGFDCLRFLIDGAQVQLGGACEQSGGIGLSGIIEWARIDVPISAGRHTLLWSYEKDGNTSVGGDAAWIDRLSLPLAAQLARLEVRRIDSAGSSGAGTVTSGAGNVIAQTFGINCGAICTTETVNGSVVTLTAIPDVHSILTGWTVNGVSACPVAQNSAASLNGGKCVVTVSNAVSTGTQVVVNFALRPVRASSTIQIVASPASTGVMGAISLQISVGGNGPTGSVNVRRVTSMSIDIICANVALTNGIALCSVPVNSQAVGPNSYQAVYSGDAINAGAQQTIQHFIAGGAANPAANVTLTIEPSSPAAGRNIRVTALVAGTAAGVERQAPQGTVRFLDSAGRVLCQAGMLLPISSTSTMATTSCVFIATAAAINPQTISAHYAPSATSNSAASASLSYTVATSLAPDYTDMWWGGDAQNGWGMSIAQHGNTQFNVLYVYDAAGKPIWVVMPGGTWNSSFTEYSGAVYTPTSTPYYANATLPFTVDKSVGNVVLTFTSAQKAVLRYNISGVSGTKNIQRQIFGGVRADEQTRGRLPVGDLWWGGIAENGWGINIAQQGTTLFGVWYTYDSLGNTTWMVLPGGTWQGNAYSGNLYTTTANAWLGTSYNANTLRVNAVGSLQIEFFDANTALMQVEIPGQKFKQVKVILRQQF